MAASRTVLVLTAAVLTALTGGCASTPAPAPAPFGVPGVAPAAAPERVVLDKIEVDPNCGPYPYDSGRAHTLVLSLRVETSDLYDPALHGIPQYFEWSTIGPDGVTEAPPTSSSDCRNGKGFPSEMRANAKYRGQVTVSTDNPTGRLVLSNVFAWDYPTK